MVVTIRYAAAALIFAAVAGSNFFWGFINHYFACGFALVGSFIAARCIERAFIKSAHREMARIYGADWCYADHYQSGSRIELLVATLVIFFIVGVL